MKRATSRRRPSRSRQPCPSRCSSPPATTATACRRATSWPATRLCPTTWPWGRRGRRPTPGASARLPAASWRPRASTCCLARHWTCWSGRRPSAPATWARTSSAATPTGSASWAGPTSRASTPARANGWPWPRAASPARAAATGRWTWKCPPCAAPWSNSSRSSWPPSSVSPGKRPARRRRPTPCWPPTSATRASRATSAPPPRRSASTRRR